MDRRDFLRLAAAGGGAVFLSGLAGAARGAGDADFYFVQLSDAHWGYKGPANPEADHTLHSAVAAARRKKSLRSIMVFSSGS